MGDGPPDRIAAALDATSDAILFVDHSWVVQYVNSAVSAVLRRPASELLGRRLWDEYPDAVGTRFWEAYHRAMDTGIPTTVEEYYKPLDAWIEVRSFPGPEGLTFFLRDVTGRHRAFALLAGQTAALQGIVAGVDVLRTFEEVTRLAEETLPGSVAAVFVLGPAGDLLELAAGPRLPPPLADAARRLAVGPAGGAVGSAAERAELVVGDAAGTWPADAGLAVRAGHGVLASWCHPLHGREGRVVGVLGCFLDRPGGPDEVEQARLRLIAELAALALERSRLDQEIRTQALHDPLTGLPNRALLIDRLEQALTSARRDRCGVALLFCDVDRLKPINDSLGHAAGDELLRALAERLQATARSADTVARLGGDEFVVLCGALGQELEAVAIADRLLAAVTQPLALLGQEIRPSVSIGVAFSEPGRHQLPPSTAAALLLRDADDAMYRSKADGGERINVFAEPMRAEAERRWELERGLRDALRRGEGLSVAYQPQVDLRTGRVVGVEALARWTTDRGTIVPPGEFIPVAEGTGLISDIGARVLHESCAALAALPSALGRPRLSVNLSARQLLDAGLPALVQSALAGAGLPGDRLCLEITETVLMEDAPGLLETLGRLRDQGVAISIDDLGTGYSSLVYLKRLPVTELKVDTSFVSGLGRNADDEAIVGAVVQLAAALGLDVVAEGVETRAQLDKLVELDCATAQGFFFTPALEAGRLQAYLQDALARGATPTTDPAGR
ncbi:putative bifunctional diguanylate cyclase/phosphodiesterase [Motilibacter aurantiacus]|uniref:putative bifunctional diguanylate cyclase/phosphodiesterase n=1 Tax=Motilibacter aurantiacus TaxID=2714955 RepID=UPI00140D6AAA|nr:EAL domain-containing protein [Motilibacter aurantiacus]